MVVGGMGERWCAVVGRSVVAGVSGEGIGSVEASETLGSVAKWFIGAVMTVPRR